MNFTRLKDGSLPSIIGRSLSLRRVGKHFIGLCPFHTEKSPSFYVHADHYHCFGCSAHGDAVDWLMKTRGMTLRQVYTYLADEAPTRVALTPITPLAGGPDPAPNPTAKLSRHVWDEGEDPAGTLVEVYLRSRALQLPEVWLAQPTIGFETEPGRVLRFHPWCQRGPRSLPGGPYYAPAMLALMTCPITGRPLGTHRTFLLPDGSGKAPEIKAGNQLLRSKSILGNWGVIRLCPDEEVGRALAIAEGIETAMSVMQFMGWGPAVWAAGSAGKLSSLPVLDGIEALHIYADHDTAGFTSSRECAARWLQDDREVFLNDPPEGKDWNDIARGDRP
jgi:hypothetical protein